MREGEFQLEGQCTDGSDGNMTPATVRLSFHYGLGDSGAYARAGQLDGACHGTVTAAAGIQRSLQQLGGRLTWVHVRGAASVAYGAGTLHNSPRAAVWSGGFWADKEFVLSFHERRPPGDPSLPRITAFAQSGRPPRLFLLSAHLPVCTSNPAVSCFSLCHLPPAA